MSIFEKDEISSLFAEVEDEPEQKPKPVTSSLFGDDDEELENNTEDDDDVEDASLFSDDDDSGNSDDTAEEDLEQDDDDGEKVKKGRKPKGTPTPFGKAYKTLIKNSDQEFLVYEGEEDREDYSEKEFIELVNQSTAHNVEKYVDATLNNIIDSFSPSVQKIIKSELRGVKVKDIIEDLKEYEEIESLPENPSNEEKEFLVKKFYKELAKEKGKNEAWVTKQVERIIDGDDLEEEFEDAKKHFDAVIEDRIAKKAEAKQKEEQEKLAFKQYHAHLVNEVLKEDDLFGIKLTKKHKDIIASTLASFRVRNTDKKEKMGLTAQIDALIHAQDKKTAYKTLALMSLAAVNPEGMIEVLNTNSETKVTKEAVKQLKIADKDIVRTSEKKKPLPSNKKSNSIFG